MISASAIRLQIESELSPRIASALTPAPRIIRRVAATGIAPLDIALHGGLPVGGISEFVGPACSGRTAVTLSFLAQRTQAANVCAWIDVSNALDLLSAAAAGVNLERLLWVRCGDNCDKTISKHRDFTLPDKYLAAPSIKRGLHGGGFGAHPRNEVKQLSDAVGNLLKPTPTSPPHAETKYSVPSPQSITKQHSPSTPHRQPRNSRAAKPWSRIEQALRATDLLLQGGGFSAIVIDMADLSPESVSRIPLATWFRYRAAAERTQSSIVLLTQYGCAKSSAELLLQFHPAEPLSDEATVFTGIRPTIEIARRRFVQTEDADVPSLRKPPQHTITTTSWHSRTTWTLCK